MKSDLLTCKPLDSFREIMKFLENPPPWRTLCKEMTPHSKYVIENKNIVLINEPSLEIPATYCHFDPDMEAPIRSDVTEKKLPKTLVCHDFANGYHEDSVIDGTVDYDGYTFYNWAGIDIFCYFSHHLITIPPVGWINVGHAHGVKVIGTIITEWSEGVQFWDSVLVSEESYRNFASAVVAIAKTLKFDGWLLNIENKISKPDMLLEFVQHLHKTLHAELTDPVLIWYDSVTIQGDLNWQNGLNEKNKAFFHACDGFFTNYSWSVSDVVHSVQEAGDRVTDLFIGIDVWGRNFYGGGQFNTQEAIKIAHKEGCSLAIFAPAWTHEATSDDPRDPNYINLGERLDKLDKFILRDRALWGSLWPFLNTRLPCQLPFQTSFCKGQGKKRRMYGEVVSPGPWYNLRHQQYQPNAAHGPHKYMLSTHEKLMKVTKTAVHKDKKGIIRYRESFQMIRNEINSIRPDDAIDSEEGSALIRRGSYQSSKSDGSDNTLGPVIREHKETQLETINNIKSESETLDNKNINDIDVIEEDIDVITAVTETVPVEPESNNKKKFSSKLKYLLKKVSFRKSHQDLGKKDKLNKLENTGASPPESTVATCSTAGTGSITEDTSSIGMSIAAVTSSLDTETDSKGEALSPLDMSRPILDDKPEETVPPMISVVEVSVNLNLSAPQKVRWELAYVEKEKECLQMYYDDSFQGGACIRVNPSDYICTEHRVTRLFHCDFYCEDTLIICVVTKKLPLYASQSLDIMLRMENSQNENLDVILVGRALDKRSSVDATSLGIKYIYPLYSEEQKVFRDLREYLLLNEPSFYVPIDNFYGWETRYYVVKVPGSHVASINCRTAHAQGGILLGHFGICPMKEG